MINEMFGLLLQNAAEKIDRIRLAAGSTIEIVGWIGFI